MILRFMLAFVISVQKATRVIRYVSTNQVPKALRSGRTVVGAFE
ncbi:hypothetical protein SP41_117 [Salmonella phage 41]|nr:hypothetical protein SP41_117 [Salmonella phage 41]